MNGNGDKFPEHQGNEQVGYGRPPAAHRFKPGQSGNPAGRPSSAGASIKEWLNVMAGWTVLRLERVVASKKQAAAKVAAANWLLAATTDHKAAAAICEHTDCRPPTFSEWELLPRLQRVERMHARGNGGIAE